MQLRLMHYLKEFLKIFARLQSFDILFWPGPTHSPPLSAGRLQVAFTPDERRALHDAVVAAAPSLPEITDFVLPGSSNEDAARPKTKLEVLAELRNMHRRRAKYRGPSAASNNYSHVLRELIKTQMECYGGNNDVQPKLDKPHTSHTQQRDKSYDNRNNTTEGGRTVKIKTEPIDEYTSEKYKENKNHESRKDYNEYREKDRDRVRYNYRHDKDRESYEKYNRKDYRSSTRAEERYSSSRDEKDKYETKGRSEKRPEYSRHSSRHDEDDRNGKSYKKEKHHRSSREKSRHRDRDRDDYSRDKTNSEQTYKRYYETLSESDTSYKNAKRKRHS